MHTYIYICSCFQRKISIYFSNSLLQVSCWLDNLQVNATVQKSCYIQNLFQDKCMNLENTY